MSSPYASQYYGTATGAMPMPVPLGKDQYASYYDNRYSVSPPEVESSVSSGAAPTFSHGGSSVANSSYAGSTHGDYDSAGSIGEIDVNEYMQERFAATFDPIPLDKTVVTQAQTSGKLNAKQRELLELQAKAQARLAKTRARFADGMQDAREVRADLEWTQKKVASLKHKASKKHAKEYQKARQRYPSPDY